MNSPLLILDFDETVTERDTTVEIARLAAAQLPVCEADELMRRWDERAQQYYAEWDRMFEAALADPCVGSDLTERLTVFFSTFGLFEQTAIDIAEQCGFLTGIPREALREVGRRAPKQVGARETVERWKARGGRVAVISANWSEDVARGGVGCDETPVHASTPEFGDNGVSTGKLNRRVVSAPDKLYWSRELRRSGERSIYVGDGANDLLAMLDSDVGVAIGGKPGIRRICGKFGIDLSPIEEYAKTRSAPTIYSAASWREIAVFLWRERVGVEPTTDD